MSALSCVGCGGHGAHPPCFTCGKESPDVAALRARVAELETLVESHKTSAEAWRKAALDAEAQVKTLTEERDEARAELSDTRRQHVEHWLEVVFDKELRLFLLGRERSGVDDYQYALTKLLKDHLATRREADRLREHVTKLIKHVGDLHHVTEPVVGIVRLNHAGTPLAAMADRTLPVFDASAELLRAARGHAPDEPVKCATFAPDTIPADVRARMDADRKAAEDEQP